MRRSQTILTVVEPTELDSIGSYDPDLLPPGAEHDLLCGGRECGEIILRSVSPEQAEYFFVSEAGRSLAECRACFSKNLLSSKVRKERDLFPRQTARPKSRSLD